jgi:hypothetical protein
MKHRNDPVEFPIPVVDYWLKHAEEYQGAQPVACDYCDEEIKQGERFFIIKSDSMSQIQRGHVDHLKHAPRREWVPDPAKNFKQPWEEDPTVPVPLHWEEWKRKHAWAVQ